MFARVHLIEISSKTNYIIYGLSVLAKIQPKCQKTTVKWFECGPSVGLALIFLEWRAWISMDSHSYGTKAKENNCREIKKHKIVSIKQNAEIFNKKSTPKKNSDQFGWIKIIISLRFQALGNLMSFFLFSNIFPSIYG